MQDPAPDSTPFQDQPLTFDMQKTQLIDMFTRIVVHYGLWFNEVQHQMGMEKALAALDKATQASMTSLMRHLSRALAFELDQEMPRALMSLDDETTEKLMAAVAKSWLANDGVWFQAVEFEHGMNDAKRCNDSCWARFSPFEAHRIKNILGLGRHPGLEGLKKALHLRMYAYINTQSIAEQTSDSFVFQMNKCRVQQARVRKGLDDYPCKSAGLVEYARFAEGVDDRIKTECIGCPPDPHPETWFCAWRFTLQ